MKQKHIVYLLAGFTMFLVPLALSAQATLASTGTSTTSIATGNPISAATVKTHFDNLYGNTTALNTQLGNLNSINWIYAAGTPATLRYTGGYFGIGTSAPSLPFELQATGTGSYIANIANNKNATDGHGLVIHAGTDTAAVGAVMIGFWSPSNHQLGFIVQNGSNSVNYSTTSDRRLKENIVDTHYSLTDLLKIQVRDFNFKSDQSKKQVTGFIAQELAPIVPDAVTIPAKTEQTWSVDYGKLTPLLVKAVQDQQKMIDSLQAANAAMRQENADLKKRLEAIEKKLGL
jgi:hypothetical protein